MKTKVKEQEERTNGHAAAEEKVAAMLEDMGCNMKVVYAQINSMEEILGEQNMMLAQIVEYMTLTTGQLSGCGKPDPASVGRGAFFEPAKTGETL